VAAWWLAALLGRAPRGGGPDAAPSLLRPTVVACPPGCGTRRPRHGAGGRPSTWRVRFLATKRDLGELQEASQVLDPGPENSTVALRLFENGGGSGEIARAGRAPAPPGLEEATRRPPSSRGMGPRSERCLNGFLSPAASSGTSALDADPPPRRPTKEAPAGARGGRTEVSRGRSGVLQPGGLCRRPVRDPKAAVAVRLAFEEAEKATLKAGKGRRGRQVAGPEARGVMGARRDGTRPREDAARRFPADGRGTLSG